jgi:hypothetical protein
MRGNPFVRALGDDDVVRARQPLQARGEVRARAENGLRVRRAAGKQVADDDPAGCQSNPHLQFAGLRCAKGADAADDVERGAHGAFGIVLVGDRVAEIGQDAVAQEAGDVAAVARDRLAAELAIDAHQLEQVFRVEPLTEARRADEVHEHDCQWAMLARSRGRDRERGAGCARRPRLHFALESASLSNCQAEFTEVLFCEVAELIGRNPLLPEGRNALGEANRGQPLFHHALRYKYDALREREAWALTLARLSGVVPMTAPIQTMVGRCARSLNLYLNPLAKLEMLRAIGLKEERGYAVGRARAGRLPRLGSLFASYSA